MRTQRPMIQRLLDRTEELIWAKQDARMSAAGWEVVHLGRWHRRYRHPALLAKALPAARLRAERESQRLAAQRAARRVPAQRSRYHHPVPARSAVPAHSAILLPGEVAVLHEARGPVA
jgi:hypothetical protein